MSPGHLLGRVRGQLEPRAARAQPSCLLNLGSSWLEDHQTKLTSLWSLQKPLCPFLASLISKKPSLAHICEPDGTAAGGS